MHSCIKVHAANKELHVIRPRSWNSYMDKSEKPNLFAIKTCCYNQKVDAFMSQYLPNQER